MAGITTRSMTPTEFDSWQQELAREYAEEQVAAGNWEASTAVERALAENARLLPDGVNTSRMMFLVAVLDDGTTVGRAWVGRDHPRGAPDTAFLWDIEIHEAVRGRGFGRALLAAVEERVAAEGVGALELNVFGSNVTAIALYERSGYRVVTQQMRKSLQR
ncbi:GNAT family N-acetyltransferase [Mycetocola zhadangensis]|uniref:GNAT family N-acetyltransferase n=1 Tax=Mycetocola zhadangensis TaxID=1164595 RepID=UPI003A4E34F2